MPGKCVWPAHPVLSVSGSLEFLRGIGREWHAILMLSGKEAELMTVCKVSADEKLQNISNGKVRPKGVFLLPSRKFNG